MICVEFKIYFIFSLDYIFYVELIKFISDLKLGD